MRRRRNPGFDADCLGPEQAAEIWRKGALQPLASHSPCHGQQERQHCRHKIAQIKRVKALPLRRETRDVETSGGIGEAGFMGAPEGDARNIRS